MNGDQGNRTRARIGKDSSARSMKLLSSIFVLLLLLGTGIALAAQGNPQTPTTDAAFGSSRAEAAVELPGKRTETSDTFSLPTGERETRIYQAPVNYETNSGKWKPIEEGLEENPGGSLVNGEGPVDVTLPSELQDGATRLGLGDSWVSAKLLGFGTEEAEVEQGTATYENPSKEISFHYSTVPYGLKEEIELEGPRAPSLFRYQLSASAGLSAELTKEGSIVFSDGSGKAVAFIPAPTVADASSVTPDAERVAYSLSGGSDGTWSLSVEVDHAWLEEPTRKWPIRIDPTLLAAEASVPTSCSFGNYYSILGYCGYATFGPIATDSSTEADSLYRVALGFNLSSIPSGADIREATLNLYAPGAAESTSGVEAKVITSTWNPENVSWTNREYSKPWVHPGGDYGSEGSEVLTSKRGSLPGWWNFEGLASVINSWRSGATLNAGLLLKLRDEGVHECSGSVCVRRRVLFASNSASEPSQRPYLKVAYWPKAPASSQVVSPKEGTTTSGRLSLKAAWTEAGVTGVTFQYRESKTGFFENIPPELVRKANGEALAKWPVAVSGVHETEPLYFDAAHLSPALRKEGGSVQVRALFEGPVGVEGYDAPVEARVNRFVGGPKDATAQVGPGTVDLLTGNLTLSRTDVSVPGFISGLEFSRNFSTRGLGAKGSTQETAENKSALGAGWKPSVPVEEAGGSEWRSIITQKFTETIEGESYEFAYATLTSSEGYEIPFEEEPSGVFVTPPELTGWKLTRASATELVLSDPAGNRTTLGNLGGGSEYVPTAISQVGSSGPTTRVEYELPEGKKRIHMVVAPTPAGVSCITQTEATGNAGCHTLIFGYAPATTWGAPAGDGERLQKITYYAPGNGGPWEVAAYKYDSNGRLIEEWNPQISPALAEKYSYNAAGQLATITPPGQKLWELAYEPFEEEAGGGRLVAAKRDSLVAGTAQTTVAYNVPVSGSGAAYELGASTISQWGQTDVPVSAAALFPPSEVPTSNPPSAYTSATVYYMDTEGFAVNTATPKSSGTSSASISTAETDEYGNVVRELTPANRLRVLGEPEGKAREERWKSLESKRHYNEQGTQMVEEWGPMHQVRLPSGSLVQARSHKVVQYENPEGLSPSPHLPVRETTGASVPGEGVDADQRVTEYQYKWSLRKPTEVVVDPGTKPEHLDIARVTAYDETTGLPIETRQPNKSGEANTPGTTRTVYYVASGPPSPCHNATFAGLPCEVLPGAQASGGGRPELLVKKFLTYNQLDEPTEVIESPGGGAENVRKTLITYDKAGRKITSRTTGGGTEVPMSETTYSSTSGAPVRQQFVCESDCSPRAPQFSMTFGASGSGEGQLNGPRGIAADKKGHVWVVDRANNRVQEFNEKGEYLGKIGKGGTGNGEFKEPWGIAVTPAGNLWVTDTGNYRVQEFNENGEFIQKFGTKATSGSKGTEFVEPEGIAIAPGGKLWISDNSGARIAEFRETVSSESERWVRNVSTTGSGNPGLVNPLGLAVDSLGNLWAADETANKVIEYNAEGTFLQTFGATGSANGQFNSAKGVTVAPSGNILVVDWGNNRVQEFKPNGEFLYKFGTFGTGGENFKEPRGVAFGAGNAVFVTDTGNNHVNKWTIDSTPSFISSFGATGSGTGQLNGPRGIAADHKGHVWVIDNVNNRVEEFDESGKYISQFGKKGSGNGEFNSPWGIAVTPAGNIWVVDTGNRRIQEFNEEGKFIQKFGTESTGPSKGTEFDAPEGIAVAPGGKIWVSDTAGARIGEFRETVSSESERWVRDVATTGSGNPGLSGPIGLAVDSLGNLWAADQSANRILEYSSEGAFVRTFGTTGSGNGQLTTPKGLAISPAGNIVVVDKGNNRVEEFQPDGIYLYKFGTSGSGGENFSEPRGIAFGAGNAVFVVDTGNNHVNKWGIDYSFDSQATTTTYDELGRPVSYEDADGNKSSVTYDLLGRPLTTSDGKGTQTATYDATSGLLTKLEDSAAGTFTAAYDADGNMTERTLPDGLTAKTTYNETDQPVHLTYTKATNCGTSCTWLDEGLERSINGQIISDSGTLSNEIYSYDKAGRLTNVNETPTGATCVTRAYAYDPDSNRASMTTRPGLGSTCSSSGGTTQSYKYDGADRLEGPTYDSWGRITSLPPEYAGGKALATTYFSNEMVASQEQGTVQNTFQLDATGRQRQRLQNGGLEGVEIFHYAGGSDSTAWTERGSAWTRNIIGIGGELVALQEASKGVTLQITDLHGDVMATADPNPATTKLIATFRFDEFGNPEEGSAGRFGWLGGESRRTELPSGVIQMGVRSYAPALGRFITPDPVPGGSANAYDYADQDPVNGADLTGEKYCHKLAELGNVEVCANTGKGLRLKTEHYIRVANRLERRYDRWKAAHPYARKPTEENGWSVCKVAGVAADTVGTIASIVGIGLDATGVGAPAGVPITLVGSSVDLAGAGLDTAAATGSC